MKLYIIEREEKKTINVEEYYTPKYVFDFEDYAVIQPRKFGFKLTFKPSQVGLDFLDWWHSEEELTELDNHHVYYIDPYLNDYSIKDYNMHLDWIDAVDGEGSVLFVDAGWGIEYSDYKVNKGTIKELFISSLTDNKEEQKALMSLSDDMLRKVAGL